MSTAKTAERLGITPRTLYRFIDDDQLPGFRFGRVIRLKWTDVEAFIEAVGEVTRESGGASLGTGRLPRVPCRPSDNTHIQRKTI